MPFGLGDIHDETVAAYKDAIAGKDATIGDLRAALQQERDRRVKSSLAAANALLGDLATFALSRLDYEKLIPSDRKLFDELQDRLTAQRLHAHLAAQPATVPIGIIQNRYDQLTPEQRERWDNPQPATAPSEVVDCESCSSRGRDCDNGDHCDNCGNRMDGDIAATADVCHDCWTAAKTRTEAEQRVLDACHLLPLRKSDDDEWYIDDHDGEMLALIESELARRGLKP